MGKHTSSDSLAGDAQENKFSTSVTATQQSHFPSDSVKKSLLEDNESAETITCEQEEVIDQSRTLDYAHLRKWNALVCFFMIAITLPLSLSEDMQRPCKAKQSVMICALGDIFRALHRKLVRHSV